jgi:hypothetical protein
MVQSEKFGLAWSPAWGGINTFRRENEDTFPIPIMFSNKSIFPIAVKLIIVVALFFSTSGCLLNRLVKTRQDLCAGHICYNTESGIITFDKPRLSESLRAL